MIMQPVPSTHLNHRNDFELLAKSSIGVSKGVLVQYIKEMAKVLGSSYLVERGSIIVLLHGKSNGIHIIIANL